MTETTVAPQSAYSYKVKCVECGRKGTIPASRRFPEGTKVYCGYCITRLQRGTP